MLKSNCLKRLSLLTLLFLIAFFSSYFLNQQVAYAKENSSMEIKTSTPEAKIEYDLPYPGILPDNPLYKLKVLRDKISIFLISDPTKRTDFYLLQADKGILATAMLVDKNKIDLAHKTALKAEHNMTLVTYELKRLSEKPSNELFEKLKTASRKHQEILGTFMGRVSSQDRKIFVTVANFSKTNLQTIEKLQKKKYYSK